MAIARARKPNPAAAATGPATIGGNACQKQADDQGRRQRRRGDVQFRPHQDRRLAGEDIADDAPDAAGEDAHRDRGERSDAKGQRLRRAKRGVGGKPDRIQPIECAAQTVKAAARQAASETL